MPPVLLFSASDPSLDISTVTLFVLQPGRDFKTTVSGRDVHPLATDSLTPSRTLGPENLTLQVIVSVESERGIDLSCEVEKRGR